MAYDDTKSINDEIKSSEYNNLIADLKGRVIGTSVNEAIADTSANRPTAGTSGRVFFETDTGRTLYDDGSSWIEVGLSESQISLANLGSNSYADLSDGSSFPIPNTDLNNSSLTVANTSISLGGSGTPEADNLGGNNGTSGQVLQSDGTNASWADLESETVKTIRTNYMTSGETTLLLKNDINAYDLSSPTAEYVLDVSGWSPEPQGIEFSDDGKTLLIADNANYEIYQHSLGTAFDLSTVDTTPNATISQGSRAVVFGKNGDYMYSANGADVDRFPLNNKYDISNLSTSDRDYRYSFTETANTLVFNDDGTRCYRAVNDTVYQYDLSTAWDVSTEGNRQSITVSPSGYGIAFNDDGSKLFLADYDGTIHEVPLSTPYDITTKGTVSTYSTARTGIYIQTIRFNGEGKLFYAEYNDAEISSELTTSEGGFNITEITLSSLDAVKGKILRVKDAVGATGTNTVTINTEGAETIDGSSSISLNTNYGVKQLQSDGTDWYLISDG